MNFRKYAGIILNILVPLLISLSRLCLGTEAGGVFLPFVIGWIVAAIANPLVRFLKSG